MVADGVGVAEDGVDVGGHHVRQIAEPLQRDVENPHVPELTYTVTASDPTVVLPTVGFEVSF